VFDVECGLGEVGVGVFEMCGFVWFVYECVYYLDVLDLFA